MKELVRNLLTKNTFKMENFPKLIKCAGWNKGLKVGIFQKINKLCCTFIRYTRVSIKTIVHA